MNEQQSEPVFPVGFDDVALEEDLSHLSAVFVAVTGWGASAPFAMALGVRYHLGVSASLTVLGFKPPLNGIGVP